MNQPVAITDESAKDILTVWQGVLSRHEIEASLSVSDRFTQLLVPAAKIVQARQLLFNRP